MKWKSCLLAAIVEVSFQIVCTRAIAHADEFECEPTHPQGGWIGTDELRVGTPAGGRFVLRPGGPGFVTKDGGLGWKFLWEKRATGVLRIEGYRLDGEAPPLRVELAPTLQETGFQPSYLIFSQPGCWRVTGSVNDKQVSIVVHVEKIGDGPAWRRD